MNCEDVILRIRIELKDYLLKNRSLKSLVCGVSGGIDSALCVTLSKPVCDELGLKLIGVSLPIISNKMDEIDRAIEVGRTFCHEFNEDVKLEFAYKTMFDLLQIIDNNDSKSEKIRKGNIKARLRMIYLYNLAFVNKGMVLSTDNYTELLLGFWTRHGDEGDFGMIQYLFKTEVYEIAKFLENEFRKQQKIKEADALQHCIDAVPTDGLGVSNSDLEQFGTNSYDETEEILKTWISWPGYEDKNKIQFANHSVVLQYEKTHFKRAGCISINREHVFKRLM